MPDLTRPPFTAVRLAEIRFNLADALDNFIREPVISSKQYIEDVRDLLASARRLTHALTACQQCQAGHELDCAALTMRAEKAEGERDELRTLADIQKESLEMFRLLLAKSDEKRTQAEARVKSQQGELGSQEVQMLQLVQESNRLKDAIRAATSQQMSAAEREAYSSNTNGAGTRGAFGAGEIMGRVSLAQGLLNLFDL